MKDATNPLEEELQRYKNRIQELEKQTEELLQIKTIFDAFLDNTSDYVYIKDADHRFLYASRPFADLTGHKSRSDIAGKTDFDIFPPEDAEAYYAEQRKVIEEGKELIGIEEPFHDTDGKRGYISTSKRPLYDSSGKIIGLVGMSRDITKIKTLEKELKTANAAKDRLFSIIGHDLRGPVGNLSVLLHDAINSNEPVNFELLQAMRTSSRTTYELLENLLQWSRGQTGQLEVNKETFFIREPVIQAIAVLEGQVRLKNINLSLLNDNISLTVHADLTMITTVVRNLISNSIKYTPAGGSITVIFEESGPEVVVKVSDSGIGMNDDQIADLFQADKQVLSSPGTDNEKGTGLGLVLCKDFIEANGGQIGVASEPGRGSTFWFSVPLSNESVESKEHITGKDYTALIVEDNYLNIQTTRLALDRLSIKYDAVMNAGDALKMAIENNYSFILMDIDLPDLNGVEASFRILEEKPDTRIFSLTSYSRYELKQKFNSLPFVDILQKPLAVNDLIPVLEKESDLNRSEDHTRFKEDRSILIVDDSEEVIRLASLFIEDLPVHMDFSLSGLDALQQIRSNAYDLILLDLELPEISGFEILSKVLKTIVPGPGKPAVIAFTAHHSQDILKKIKQSGFDGFITKPFSKTSLRKEILQYLE